MTQLVFFDARWDKEIELNSETINHLKENNIKSVALFASVQFLNLDKVKSQLENLKIKILITKAKRTSNPLQILGCDAYHDSFEEPIIDEAEIIMYVGDGLFHPKALLIAQIKKQNIKPVLIYDPTIDKMSIITEKDIQEQVQRTKRNLKMFVSAKTIGILVTIKPGQQYFNAAKRLKEHLLKENKKAYIFIDDSLDLRALENYPFIDAWVNTACPRIGTDDLTTIPQPLLNLREAGDPIKALEELEFRN